MGDVVTGLRGRPFGYPPLRPFRRAAAVLAGDLAKPPSLPRPTANGFLSATCDGVTVTKRRDARFEHLSADGAGGDEKRGGLCHTQTIGEALRFVKVNRNGTRGPTKTAGTAHDGRWRESVLGTWADPVVFGG